jgi:hypothetical protein
MNEIEQKIIAGLGEATTALPNDYPHRFDKWVCSSALQKSLRRGYLDTALLMARAFLDNNPTYFWRRINVIMLEDVGIANLPLVNQVLWMSGKRKWIERIGEAKLMAYLVEAICQSPKDRNACEIVQAVDTHLDHKELRQTLPTMPLERLKALYEQGNPFTATMAAWCLLGTKKYYAHHFYAEGHHLGEAVEMMNLTEEERLTLQLSRGKQVCAIPIGVLGYSPFLKSSVQVIAREQPNNPQFIGHVPACAYDKHTRAGKRAILNWLNTNPRLNSFLKAHVPQDQWLRYVGLAIFALETENVNLRLTYDDWGKPLRQSTEGALLTDDFNTEHLNEFLRIAEGELAGLNEIRKISIA